MKELIPFTIEIKRIICLGKNLPKETKELYTENYKTLRKEIKGTLMERRSKTLFADDVILYTENPKELSKNH